MDDFLTPDLLDAVDAVGDVLAGLTGGPDAVDVTADLAVPLTAPDAALPDGTPDTTDGGLAVAAPVEPVAVDPFLTALTAGTGTHVVGTVLLESPFAPGYWA